MTAPGAISIGSDLGPYRLTARIGEGGMSAVFRADHRQSGRPCAVKVMKAEFAGDAAFRERFVREWSYAAGVRHDHIVPVLDAGESEGLLYLVMQYVEGSDLRRLLNEAGRLEPARALRILEQIASALDAVHAAGMIHRDVKPGNILLDAHRAERAYLADFGLTKNPSEETVALTAAGTFVGTIDYTPPEQILAQPLSAAVDVYALGCVLYYCLAGAPPFAGRREVDVMRAHISDPPPSLSEATGLPAALDAVVAAALAKEPGARPATCGELIERAAVALGIAQQAAAAAPARLRVVEGPAAGLELEVPAEGDLTLGRAAPSPGDLGSDHGLSRLHARLSAPPGGLEVSDLGSTNGTHVNADRLTEPCRLAVGDRLHVGNTELEVVALAGKAVAPTAEPERRISVTLDFDLDGGGASLRLGPGTRLRQDGEGSWRIEPGP